MKIHLLNRSLLALVLSSGALVAATSTTTQPFQPPATLSGSPIIVGPVSFPLPATAPIGVFTERDAGTPISIPLNGQFRVRLTTDSKVDPVGSFWFPVSYSGMELTLKDRTTNNWFNQGSERQISNTFFTFKPLAAGSADILFELAQWVPVASDSANGTASQEAWTVIRTISFPMTIVAASDTKSTQPSQWIPIGSDVQ